MVARGGGRARLLALLATLALHGVGALDVVDADSMPRADAPRAPGSRRESAFLRGVRGVVGPPVKMFREAPPITRSWVSASVVVALVTSQRWVDLKSLCFSERAVVHNGEWWRLVTNFFFMGDALTSIFFWVQIYHFCECLKVLELVKYRWEPADFIKMIVCSAAGLLLLKQYFPSMIFLGSPMVMVFVYIYARTYEAQVMNLFGFFQIQCGWLPFTQMLQDLLQVRSARSPPRRPAAPTPRRPAGPTARCPARPPAGPPRPTALAPAHVRRAT